MKKLIVLPIVLSLAACSSNPVQQQKAEKQAQIDSVGQDKEIGDQAPEWTTFNGIEGSNMLAVGVAEANIDASPIYLKRAAMLDAESQLFQKAPHEYREIVQHALDGLNLDQAQYRSIQTKLLRLSGVTGIRYPAEKSFCQKMARDNGDHLKITRVCFQQAQIPIEAMNETIERTLAKYYGKEKSAEFSKLMDSELQKLEGDKNAKTNSVADDSTDSPSNSGQHRRTRGLSSQAGQQ